MFTNIRRYPKTTMSYTVDSLPNQHLSISPAEISALTARGMSATSSNLGLQFSEGSPDPVLQLEQTRGLDPADIWTASQTAAANLSSAHKKDKQTYG